MKTEIIEPVKPSPEMKRKLFARVDADLAQKHAQSNTPVFQQVEAPMQSRAWFIRPRFAFLLFVIFALLAVGAWIFLNRM